MISDSFFEVEGLMCQYRPYFIITVDTEADPSHDINNVPVTNADHLQNFQDLAEKYSLKVTYLVTYHMARTKQVQDMVRHALKDRTAEIGMHLHAWDTPPLSHLTDYDPKHQTYITDYDETVIRRKMTFLAEYLRKTYRTDVVSHRGGKWGLDRRVVRILMDLGFKVDCSVTPFKNWANHEGIPGGKGGPDYRSFPDTEYFMDPAHIDRPGGSDLLEVPLSVIPNEHYRYFKPLDLLNKWTFRNFNLLDRTKGIYWLRPNGTNDWELEKVLDHVEGNGRNYAQMMIHSTDLSPGFHSNIRDETELKRFYGQLDRLFRRVSRSYEGITLGGYYDRVVAARKRGKLDSWTN